MEWYFWLGVHLIIGGLVYFYSLRLNRARGAVNPLFTHPVAIILVVFFWPVILLIGFINGRNRNNF